MKRGIPFCVWRKVNGNWGTTWLEFVNVRKTTVEEILNKARRIKSRRAGLWESQSEVRAGILTIQVRSFDMK